MNKKSIIIGIIMGFVLCCILFMIVGYVTQQKKDNSIQYLEKPVSYENKEEASFRVIQVMDPNTALANEGEYLTPGATTVVLVGSDFYSDQIVTVKNPQRIGTYSYISGGGLPMTVPVIKGDISADRVEKSSTQLNNTEISRQEPYRHLEQPESYEGKKKTSFKVYNVVQDGYALAREESDRIGNDAVYYGNEVLLQGEDFYDGQVITVRDPQKIGIFKYYDKTVPVINSKNK